MPTDREGCAEGGALSRRTVLKSGLALSAAALLTPDALARLRLDAASDEYLNAARKAGRWMAGSAIADEKGTHWPADPANPTAPALDLYNGTTGVIPFWLELHHATKDNEALAYASAGADYLLSTLPRGRVDDAGLYTGLAGIAWVLEMTYRATHDARYRDGASRALEMITTAARPHASGKGVIWADSTDIISGAAGTGLYLLWARKERHDAQALEVAARAGEALIAAGEATRDGLRWKVNARMARNYPNFSHGAGGVSYFLASLHQATGERAFLDAALAGARYLSSLATTTPNGGRMVFHSEPGMEQVFYLSWCHGPAGTARLYHRLGEITGDAAHATHVDRLATGIVDMKVPEQSPGYWNNISQCCGNGGVIEFFTSMYGLRRNAAHLAFAQRVARDTLARATADGDGLKWIQAENRTSPNAVAAQTGLMQGAAGVGVALLHLDGAMRGRAPFIVLPDNPFA